MNNSPYSNRKLVFNHLKHLNKFLKKAGLAGLSIFILINAVAFFHAYKFTHFSDRDIEKTKDPGKLSAAGKIQALVFGVDNPRPVNRSFPTQDYETIVLKSNTEIECWGITTKNAKGTVILFHGYSGQKSSMLDKSNIFLNLGYNTFLVDFMGSGNSEGNRTTIGYAEATQVKTCFDYLRSIGETNIYLFGTSMGSVAIMKAVADYGINPGGIIIECPFGSMYETVCARFNTMNAPTFPMAGLLVLWGGIQNGFWAFEHNPTEYAASITCPVLLLYGEQDEKVSRKEIDEIYTNLKGSKQLKTYANAGHENYLVKYRTEWINDITQFLDSSKTGKDHSSH